MISFIQSQKFRAGLPTVLFITFLWLLIAAFEVSFDYLNFLQYDIFPADYNVWVVLKSELAGVGVAAFLAGCLFVYWVKDNLQNHCYGKVLWNIFCYYNIIFFFAIVVGSAIHKCEMNDLLGLNNNILTGVWEYILALKFIRGYFFWAIVSLLTMIALQVNDKYGAGVFWAFLRGDYFQPQKEERIFMFLDLRGSTTIAEKIGEELYFDFIRDFFKDVTPSILANKGEIYQYVGDEVIISWKKEKGLKNEQALNCFFDIEKAISNKELYYLEKYGVIPSFKAGLHIGTAMIGEIGVIKKDIAFSGDVLNTTSRIQTLCNEFGVDLLVSKELVEALNLTEKNYQLRRLGEVHLRGREKTVTLFTVTKTILVRNITPIIKNKRIWDFAF
ncbi:MAG: adenylate/guanylate cyclase domain-containing protein [Saprospiraceae bacterium]